MNANQFAAKVHDDGKRVRKFLRDTTPKEMQPGRGHKWELPDSGREVTQLKRRYARWAKSHTR